MPWGTAVGLNWSGRSGAVYSDILNYQGYNLVFYKGRGSLGRSPFESQFDLLLQQDFRFGKRYVLNLNLNCFNLFDNDVATVIYGNPYRDRFTLTPPEAFFNGFNADAMATANPAAYRPDARYKLNSGFLGRRDLRIGASFRF
jgi:hypothetical protein